MIPCPRHGNPGPSPCAPDALFTETMLHTYKTQKNGRSLTKITRYQEFACSAFYLGRQPGANPDGSARPAQLTKCLKLSKCDYKRADERNQLYEGRVWMDTFVSICSAELVDPWCNTRRCSGQAQCRSVQIGHLTKSLDDQKRGTAVFNNRNNFGVESEGPPRGLPARPPAPEPMA